MNLFIATPLFSIHVARQPRGQSVGWGFERHKSVHHGVGGSLVARLGRLEVSTSKERLKEFTIQW